MEVLIDDIVFNYSYVSLYGLTVVYFLFLYFGVGVLFLYTCRFLASKNILHRIETKVPKKQQLRFEIRHSVQSILVFGFSIIPIMFLARAGYLTLLSNTWQHIILGLVLLTLWNEVHFYVVHRILHQKFMMRQFHYIHHTSAIPTVFSVYSFHWLEAFLLSTVPLTIVPFIPISIVAVFIFPLVSILLNFAGHCNYRFGDGQGNGWRLFATHHNQHHSRARKNYGFALPFLDILFSKHNK